MSDGNGHEPTGVPVAAALMPQPMRVRSKLLDALVAEVNDIATKHNAMVRSVSADIAEHRAILDAHAGVVNRRTLWGRLRWLVLGV